MVGVIVGRFQVAQLTKGHEAFLNYVLDHHDRVLVLLGVAAAPVTSVNPLDYFSRAQMLRDFDPRIETLPIPDMPSDEDWSVNLDHTLELHVPHLPVMLYSGRDGFAPRYHGHHKLINLAYTGDLDLYEGESGTVARERLKNRPLPGNPEVSYHTAWREGAIWATQNQYPRAVMCVDIGVFQIHDPFTTQSDKSKMGYLKEPIIYLGRKSSDPVGKYRLFGGHVNPHETLEAAAIREASEECGGLHIYHNQNPVYLASRTIDDWRYRKGPDKILSALFALEHSGTTNITTGMRTDCDDIEEVRAFKLSELANLDDLIAAPHIHLAWLFRGWLATHFAERTHG